MNCQSLDTEYDKTGFLYKFKRHVSEMCNYSAEIKNKGIKDYLFPALSYNVVDSLIMI